MKTNKKEMVTVYYDKYGSSYCYSLLAEFVTTRISVVYLNTSLINFKQMVALNLGIPLSRIKFVRVKGAKG